LALEAAVLALMAAAACFGIDDLLRATYAARVGMYRVEFRLGARGWRGLRFGSRHDILVGWNGGWCGWISGYVYGIGGF
jgi:hypothetical protein